MSQLHPTKCNCWQLCLEKTFFCCSSCWVSRIASLTFRPCYTFKCLWGIWISDEVVFFKKNPATMTSLHFCNEFLCIWCYWKRICIFVHLSCKDVQKWLVWADLVIKALYICEEQISNHSLEWLPEKTVSVPKGALWGRGDAPQIKITGFPKPSQWMYKWT